MRVMFSRFRPVLALGRAFLAAILAAAGGGHAIADPLLRDVPLEESRVHPSLSGTIPDFPSSDGSYRLAMFNESKRDNPPRAIYFRVPEEFMIADRLKVYRVWALNLLVHYPEMTGPRNPVNRGKIGVCPGPCPGDMLITIANRIGDPLVGAARRALALEEEMTGKFASPHLLRFVDMPSGAFTRIVRRENIRFPENSAQNNMYYFVTNGIGSHEFMAQCSHLSPVQLCTAYTESRTYLGLDVRYTFLQKDIGDWRVMQNRVLSFIDGIAVGIFDYVRAW